MGLNEWGDFVAGVSAPLAFLWLVVAVFIQSRELSEQRAELRLTRREFELNRDVMKAQANDARQQAAFIGKQTEIMTKDAEDALRRTKEADLETTISELSSLIRQHLFNRPIIIGIGHMGKPGKAYFEETAGDKEGWILHFTEFMHNFANSGLGEPYYVHPDQADNVSKVYKMALSTLNQAKELGSHSLHRIERIRVQDLLHMLVKVLAVSDCRIGEDTIRFRTPAPTAMVDQS